MAQLLFQRLEQLSRCNFLLLRRLSATLWEANGDLNEGDKNKYKDHAITLLLIARSPRRTSRTADRSDPAEEVLIQ